VNTRYEGYWAGARSDAERAGRERDQAIAARAAAEHERDQARRERDQAVADRQHSEAEVQRLDRELAAATARMHALDAGVAAEPPPDAP
jgi:hypothetical protein